MDMCFLRNGAWFDRDKADEYAIYDDCFIRTKKGAFVYRLQSDSEYKLVTEEQFIGVMSKSIREVVQGNPDYKDDVETKHPKIKQVKKAWKLVFQSDLEI